jgi:riboflavin kinase
MVGIVCSGAGVHHGIMPNDNKAIKETIGFVPYPGTLNVRLNERLQLSAPIVIHGLMWLYPIMVNGLPCYAIRRSGPYQDNITGALGIMASVCLRDKFNLKDGDTVNVEVVKRCVYSA